MTVSNVLNGRYRSSPHRDAILEAVARLNYQLDPSAQRLAAGQSRRMIGIFSLAMDLGVFTLTMTRIQRRLVEQGYTVPLDVHNLFHEAANADQIALIRNLCQQRPRAIVANTAYMSKAALGVLKEYQDGGGEVVRYGMAPTDTSSDEVVFDEESNSYRAALALIRAGHTKMGFRSHGFPKAETLRMRGFRRALEEHGLAPRAEWMFSGPTYEEGGADLARQFLELRERPTGICIVNDNSASAFVNQITRAGFRVPDDVSVVGHDDMPAAKYALVPLTTAAFPVAEIADAVASLLLGRLEGSYQGPRRLVTFAGDVVARESVAAPRG